jgi:hypothetical protein
VESEKETMMSWMSQFEQEREQPLCVAEISIVAVDNC